MDKAGLQAAVCETQATHIAKMKESVSVAGFGGKSQALYATCELLAPCCSTTLERQLGLPKQETLLEVRHTKSNRARQQVEAEVT